MLCCGSPGRLIADPPLQPLVELRMLQPTETNLPTTADRTSLDLSLKQNMLSLPKSVPTQTLRLTLTFLDSKAPLLLPIHPLPLHIFLFQSDHEPTKLWTLDMEARWEWGSGGREDV